MKHTKNIFLISSLILSILNAHVASPSPIKVFQPNGNEITIHVKGDHLHNWHDYNGWTIVKDNDWWVYALGNNGKELIPSQIKVDYTDNPNEINPNIEKGIKPDPYQLIDNSPIPNLQLTRSDTFRVPLILVEFPDAGAVYESSQLDSMMNQQGYTHLNYDNTGSFRDFYQEISHGQFLPIADISRWFTAPNNHDYYGYNNGYQSVRQLVRDMVDSLEASGFNWSIYDNDGDGYVDALTLIHQGPGAEEGDQTNIWSHKWNLGNLAVSYDGVIIDSYNMNPEIQNGNIVAIGVLAHEFGHSLGLPDLYDTDYSSTGAGKLSLMASGSWGTSGNTPWYPSSMIGWIKNELGWVDIVEIDEDQTNVAVEQSYSSNIIYRVNHSQVEEEYWLIENRQKIGSDTLITTPGLTIWHINENIAQGWAPNNDEPYYGVGLEQADGMFALENGGPSNGADVFPGDLNNREFSHSSNPNTTSLYGEPSLLRLDNISDPGAFMTFDVEYNELILASAYIEDGSGIAYNSGYISLGMDNEMDFGEFEFQIDFSPAYVEITNLIPTERFTFDSFQINNNHITFVNPLITSGNGPILTLELFNNVGVETEVIVTYDMCLAYTTEGDEVGISILDNALYQIEAPNQTFNIVDGTGSIGGGASIILGLENTVPIAMAVVKISNEPQVLIPSDEPFEDLNGNGVFDEGENFVDWNENNVWSPMVEILTLSENWDITVDPDDEEITIGITNWQEPLEPDSRQLFRINYSVGEAASLNDIISITSESLLLLDAWGNNGATTTHNEGTVTINDVLSNSESLGSIPTHFSIDKVFPNPFNPITNISFSVPMSEEEMKISIYNILGSLQAELLNGTLDPGRHSIDWDASKNSSGIYFIELKTDQFREIKKVTLIK